MEEMRRGGRKRTFDLQILKRAEPLDRRQQSLKGTLFFADEQQYPLIRVLHLS